MNWLNIEQDVWLSCTDSWASEVTLRKLFKLIDDDNCCDFVVYFELYKRLDYKFKDELGKEYLDFVREQAIKENRYCFTSRVEMAEILKNYITDEDAVFINGRNASSWALLFVIQNYDVHVKLKEYVKWVVYNKIYTDRKLAFGSLEYDIPIEYV